MFSANYSLEMVFDYKASHKPEYLRIPKKIEISIFRQKQATNIHGKCTAKLMMKKERS